eukprot:3123327-Ditylum_brightwellii.AAC.1
MAPRQESLVLATPEVGNLPSSTRNRHTPLPTVRRQVFKNLTGALLPQCGSGFGQIFHVFFEGVLKCRKDVVKMSFAGETPIASTRHS